MKKNVSARMGINELNILNNLYGNQAKGVARTGEVFVYMRRAIVQTLLGVFSKEEIMVLKEVYKHFQIEPVLLNHEIFITMLNEAEKHEGTASQAGADINGIISKVKRLTIGQLYILNEEIDRYWNNGNGKHFLQE